MSEQIMVKSSNGITLVSLNSRLMNDRKIFIEGEIGYEMACSFVKKIMLLTQDDSSKPIDVFINSPGGEINSGMLIYDIIQSSKTPIRMFCIGRAYSMGALLFACGNHGRYMLPNGELMIHEPLLGNRVGGNSSSIKSISESLLETKNKMNQLLARHTGKTEEDIEKATSYDHYFNSDESVEFGLCDGIVGIDKMMEA